MISYLNGKILNKSQNYIIIKAGDVGYQVFVNPVIFADLEIGQDIEIYIHQYVREDALDLYGFKSMEELDMFELLISISGIGPKSALGVLAIASVADIKESISRGDSALLTKVSGIGRKTAGRVVLELREKIGNLSRYASGENGTLKSGTGSASGDEIDALMALGYSMPQARDALRAVDSKIKDSGERIKQALKGM
ncbi:MAG: Holliday junction branch migration protein RuvA [Patescibacteria group bacterium]|nr:Holliday junction branch migration protein RuvA [Patescibacteria group bacterium]